MSQIIVFPRGQLTERDHKRLAEIGVVAVEADDPTKVVCAIPAVPFVSSDDLLISALIGLTSKYASSNSQTAFVEALAKRVVALPPQEQPK